MSTIYSKRASTVAESSRAIPTGDWGSRGRRIARAGRVLIARGKAAPLARPEAREPAGVRETPARRIRAATGISDEARHLLSPGSHDLAALHPLSQRRRHHQQTVQAGRPGEDHHGGLLSHRQVLERRRQGPRGVQRRRRELRARQGRGPLRRGDDAQERVALPSPRAPPPRRQGDQGLLRRPERRRCERTRSAYELIDEMLDHGYAQTTDTETLKQRVFNEPIHATEDVGKSSLGGATPKKYGASRPLARRQARGEARELGHRDPAGPDPPAAGTRSSSVSWRSST